MYVWKFLFNAILIPAGQASWCFFGVLGQEAFFDMLMLILLLVSMSFAVILVLFLPLFLLLVLQLILPLVLPLVLMLALGSEYL